MNALPDIRYNFLGTLDHFPSELIRSLWVIQSLNFKSADETQKTNKDLLPIHLRSKTQYVQDLIQEQIDSLNQYQAALRLQRNIVKTAEPVTPARAINLRNYSKQAATPSQFKIKLHLKKRQEPIVERYCFCNRESYGEMIACDNPNCPYEWFHYDCIGMTQPPKGKWYCSPNCKKQASFEVTDAVEQP